jgi:protein-S-isoprenylcysteine O-methyltransferase Ste14
MKTNHAPVPTSAATWQAFFQQLRKKAPDKWLGLILALLLYYGVPLLGKHALLMSPQVLLAVFGCTIVYLVQPATNPKQTKSPSDKYSMWGIIAATTISQESIVIDWAYFHINHRWMFDAPTVAGLGLIVLGLWVRTLAIYELGFYFDNTVTIKGSHELIQTGIYRYIRHGSYTGAILVGLGIGFMLSAWWGVAISVVVLGVGYGYRIKHEEAVLLAHFGDAYRIYQTKTWKLIPFIY